MLYATETIPDALTSAGVLMNHPTKQEESQMAYVLEKLTPEDIQKIIDDAATHSAERQRWLGYARKDGKFPESWAIDRERNHYLFEGPFLFAHEVEARPYYVFVYGRMYIFNWVTLTQFDFFIDEHVLPLPEDLLRIQQEVVLALQCHGTGGSGYSQPVPAEQINFVQKPTNLTEI
jgi:hypothetical protein